MFLVVVYIIMYSLSFYKLIKGMDVLQIQVLELFNWKYTRE